MVDDMSRPAIIQLLKIPTIRSLYASSTLKPSKEPKYSAKKSLLEKVSLWQGDITKLEVDAIVNAANRSLLGGSGVDGAIHGAAGRGLLEECETLHGANTGEAKITKGYNLPSKHVIHAVGPVYNSSAVDKVASELASCYKASLDLGIKYELKTVAFPSISTGIYGYPIADATHIALKTVREVLDENEEQFDRVIFVVFSDKDKGVYETLIPEYFPSEQDT
ncbi:A1pp-domain-containing protein [Marasmius fiardii PR-910]|nr:A1pp-domain-containing protein [Marasmius fiardii PR-910]